MMWHAGRRYLKYGNPLTDRATEKNYCKRSPRKTYNIRYPTVWFNSLHTFNELRNSNHRRTVIRVSSQAAALSSLSVLVPALSRNNAKKNFHEISSYDGWRKRDKTIMLMPN
jgi:hypothetical protein